MRRKKWGHNRYINQENIIYKINKEKNSTPICLENSPIYFYLPKPTKCNYL